MKNNPRITPKEKGLLKGAIRRVFSRSDLRRSIIDASIVKDYTDIKRKRVKTWCRCNECKELIPKSYMEVDHIIPVVPLNKAFADMSLDVFVDGVWCEGKLLQAICENCHDVKTKAEGKERRRLKKEAK